MSSPTTYDSEEEPPVKQELCWRMPPEDSLSDWQIEIIDSSTQECTSYHIHRSLIAVGPNSSDYFARLFQNGEFAEAKSKMSRIELHPLAAKAFPMLLDFCYRGKIDFDDDNVTALHHLGQYFQIRQLRWEAKQFWQKSMNLENCGEYYRQASILQDEKVITAVQELCIREARNQNPVPPSCPKDKLLAKQSIIRLAGAAFWLGVLEAANDDAFDLSWSQWASKIIASVLHHEKQLDADLFQKLTDQMLLPEIDPIAAQVLLEKHDHINQDKQQDTLSCLEKRCVKAMAESWADLCPESEEFTAFLQKRSPVLLAELFKELLFQAKITQLELARMTIRSQQLSREVSGNEKKIKNLEQELEKTKSKLAEKRQKLERYKRKLYEQREDDSTSNVEIKNAHDVKVEFAATHHSTD